MTEMDREAMRRYVVEPMLELLAYTQQLEEYVVVRSEYEELAPQRQRVHEAFAKMDTYFAPVGREGE